MALTLQIKNLSNGETQEFSSENSPLLLGRSKICDVSLLDSALSRQHASLLVKSESEVELEDLKSANGTTVNGSKITKVNLNEGSKFNIGQYEIKILKIELKKEIDSEDLTPGAKSITLVPEPAEPSAKKPAAAPAPVAAVPTPAPTPAAPKAKPAAPAALPTAHIPEELTMKTPVFLKEGGPAKTLFQTKDWVQVSLLWKDSLVDIKCFDRGDIVTIGEDDSNDFNLSIASLPKSFKFLKILPTGVEIHLHPAMKGLVETKDQVVELDQLKSSARQTPLGLSTHVAFQDRCLIEMGPFSFFIKSKKLSLTAPLSAPFMKDPFYAGVLAASFLMMVLFLTGIRGITVPEKEAEKEPENIVSLAPPTESPKPIPPPPPPPPPPKTAKTGEEKSVKKQLSGQEGEGAKATGEEGKAGRTTGTVKARARPIGMVTQSEKPLKSIPKGAFGKEVDPRTAKLGKRPDEGIGSGKPKPKGTGTQAPSKEIKPNVKVEDMGISGVMSSRSGGGGTATEGGAMEGAGLGGELEGSVEGLERGSDIDNKGSGGRGAKGIGLGGGGSSIEVGGLSTKGKGGGKSGFGLGSSGKKGDADVSYSAEDVEVRDGLTREEIERVVNANADDITRCYEQALIQGGSSLGGRLKVGWFVNRDGRAQNVVQEAGIPNGAGLFQCIASKITTWQFPRPRGGSGAQVSWPWVFRKGG